MITTVPEALRRNVLDITSHMRMMRSQIRTKRVVVRGRLVTVQARG